MCIGINYLNIVQTASCLPSNCGDRDVYAIDSAAECVLCKVE